MEEREKSVEKEWKKKEDARVGEREEKLWDGWLRVEKRGSRRVGKGRGEKWRSREEEEKP